MPPPSVRWILVEEAHRYQAAFGLDAAENAHEAAAAILQRFLDTHALVGLDDILQRYPFERAWAQSQLEEWTRKGRLVRIVPAQLEPLQWSAPENFDQMQRGTLSIMRREVLTCPAAQFADFVARWQHVHPATQVAMPDGLPEVLHRLQGCLLPGELWEQVIFPMRCRSYSPRHLDELIAGGGWTWYCSVTNGAQPTAFIERQLLPLSLPPRAGSVSDGIPQPAGMGLDQASASMLELLRTRGALFATELASHTKLPLPTVRSSLWSLLRSGLVTNDRYDLLRRGEPPHDEQAPPLRSRGQLRAFLRDSRRRQTAAWPEGRWSLLAWGQPDPETAAFFHARLLLNRFGIVARELANMSGITTPWRILYEILSRLELSGEVRRGYFVEGLSGAQFALPDAAALLHENALPSHAQAPVLLLHSLDPANLYGSGAALELMVPSDEACHAHARPGLATGPAEALRGHATPFQCRANNWLVMKAGRPLLLIELQGKRLTAMPQATTDDLAKAAARLPDLLKLAPNRDARHKLRVETWNDQPVAGTPGRHLLEQVGFVRDYQAMTLYAVWQT